MPNPVVVFDSVWKKFRRGERHDSLRDLVPAMMGKLVGRPASDELKDQEFWAVRDLGFEVMPGEAVGIIGPNGAGKSTALKLLTRILRPTRGLCSIKGRVGALIEVSAGFHNDLTGRENIYLQGAIMGMRRQEIEERIDQIIDFSGVSAFIDTQVKRYSSGMSARLGFSVAAHLRPDVLIVDEVLSVGDLSFQQKCTERMKQQIAEGTTVIFVSHNLQAVSALCSRVVVMRSGEKAFDGEPIAGLEAYVRAGQAGSTMYGAGRARFESLECRLERDLDDPTAYRLHFRVRCTEPCPAFNIGFEVERLRDLMYCYGITSEGRGAPLYHAEVGQEFTATVTFRANLLRGHYRVNVNFRDPTGAAYLFYGEAVATFAIDEDASYDGIANLDAEFTAQTGADRLAARGRTD